MQIFLVILSTIFTHAADLDFHGYLRAGAGSNGKGAKQECFNNPGAPGNEFRLGNECSIYGEAAFGANFLETKDPDPFFRSQMRFAFYPSGNSSFEQSNVTVAEAYVEGGNLDGSPLSYWAGKRFYRDVDLYIYDWYYYGHMSGNGGGVGNIPLGSGTLAAAFLFETGDTRTNVGLNQTQIFDLRWHNVSIGSKDQLNFWTAFGQAPGGTANGIHYRDRSGWLGAIRWRRNLDGGFNDFTVGHGRNLLESLSLYGDPTLERTAPIPGPRWRFVEHLVIQPNERFGLFGAAALELWNPRTPNIDARGRWWSIGARPVFFFTKHHQLAFEAGHSVMLDRSERNATGQPLGNRTLTRFTIAPQLSVGPGLWTRPLLRAYYSRTFWNSANRARMATQVPSFAGSHSGQALGMQAELWF